MGWSCWKRRLDTLTLATSACSIYSEISFQCFAFGSWPFGCFMWGIGRCGSHAASGLAKGFSTSWSTTAAMAWWPWFDWGGWLCVVWAWWTCESVERRLPWGWCGGHWLCHLCGRGWRVCCTSGSCVKWDSRLCLPHPTGWNDQRAFSHDDWRAMTL